MVRLCVEFHKVGKIQKINSLSKDEDAAMIEWTLGGSQQVKGLPIWQS
jgi:hypothetical protein